MQIESNAVVTLHYVLKNNEGNQYVVNIVQVFGVRIRPVWFATGMGIECEFFGF